MDSLRAVSAADGQASKPFDYVAYESVIKALAIEDVVEEVQDKLKCRALGVPDGFYEAFCRLRSYARARVMPLVNEEPLLKKVFSTVFCMHLAHDVVHRVDVVQTAQLLSVLRTLLFAWSDGASDCPYLALFFAFGANNDQLRAVLESAHDNGDVDNGDDNVDDDGSSNDRDAALEKLLHCCAAGQL